MGTQIFLELLKSDLSVATVIVVGLFLVWLILSCMAKLNVSELVTVLTVRKIVSRCLPGKKDAAPSLSDGEKLIRAVLSNRNPQPSTFEEPEGVEPPGGSQSNDLSPPEIRDEP